MMDYWDYWVTYDEVDDKVDQKRILWLSVDKYVPKPFSDNYVMDVQHAKFADPIDKLQLVVDRIINGKYGYVVVIISEGILLSMTDKKYKEAVFSVIEALCVHSIPHTIFICEYLFKDREFRIITQDYSINYLRSREYRIHTSIVYDLIREYYPNKTDVFEQFLSKYIQGIIFRTHDRGHEDLLSFMLDSSLVGDIFSSQEKQILLATCGSAFFFDAEEADAYKSNVESSEHVKYLADYKIDALSSGPSFYDDSYIHDSSDGYKLDKILFSDFSVSHLIKETPWKNSYSYAKRNCKERKTASSVSTMTNTLSKKLFSALIETMDRVPDVQEKSQMVKSATMVLTELMRNKDANILPFSDIDEIYVYMENILGKETHTVSRQYFLRDYIWADELDQYLTMFQNYMSDVQHIKISIDREYTENGILYVISSSSNEVLESNFPSFTDAFAQFLNQVALDQDAAAREIVDKYNISETHAERIVRDYHRKCNTLRREMKYNYQRCMLDIQEELENDLSEEIDRRTMHSEMKKHEDQIDAIISSRTDIIEIGHEFPQEIASISSMITGDYKYSDWENEIIQLFWKYDSNPPGLISELNIARDMNSLEKKRTGSVMRIMQFLGRYEDQIGADTCRTLFNHVSSLRGYRIIPEKDIANYSPPNIEWELGDDESIPFL